MSSASGSTSRIERFGPFWFDLDRTTLYRGNEPVILARKRLEVLQLLAEHAGTIVRKEEIIERVWPNQHIDENNLTLQIFNLRRDLEDDPKRPIYIITAPASAICYARTRSLHRRPLRPDLPHRIRVKMMVMNHHTCQAACWFEPACSLA